jgi:hypothetical protein
MRMTAASILMLALIVLALGCSEESSTKPEGHASPYSGRFYIEYTITYTNCLFPAPLDGPMDIVISGEDLSWGTIEGHWDESTAHGWGHSTAPTCIPINPSIGCEGCFMTSFDVTYVTVDSLAGTVGLAYTYTAPCNTDSCHTNYAVTGKRM